MKLRASRLWAGACRLVMTPNLSPHFQCTRGHKPMSTNQLYFLFAGLGNFFLPPFLVGLAFTFFTALTLAFFAG